MSTLRQFFNWSSYDGRARLAACGVSLVAVAILFGMLVALLAAVGDSRAELAESSRIVERATNAASRTGTDDPRAQLKRALIDATNSADVQARFQTALKATADAHGVVIDTLQMLKVEPAGGLMRHKLRLVGAIPERNFGVFVITLAQQEPSIFVVSADVQVVPQRAARLNAANAERMLALRLDVSAFSPAGPRSQAAGGS